MIYVNGSGFCDDQAIVFSTIGQGPKGDKGDKGDSGDSATIKDINKAVSNYLDNHPEYITNTIVILANNDQTANTVTSIFGDTPNILKPSDVTDIAHLMPLLNDKSNLAWKNGNKLEVAPIRINVNGSNVVLYAKGFETMATGVMGVDTQWSIVEIGSGSYTDGDEVNY